jgi:hypothetical protein
MLPGVIVNYKAGLEIEFQSLGTSGRCSRFERPCISVGTLEAYRTRVWVIRCLRVELLQTSLQSREVGPKA